MLQKDKRRADRRWRSYHKFIRRLKTDWNDHRWNWNYLTYPRSRVGITPEVACSFWAGTTLCGCFWNPKEMARFKDTPTGNHSKRECGCSDPMTEYKDEVKRAVEREDWHKKKSREGTRLVKLSCMKCGIMLCKKWVEFGKPVTRDGVHYCEACDKRSKESRILKMPA